MHDPPAGAELYVYRDSPDVPVSRHLRPGLGADFVTLLWTPDPLPCSNKTAWRAVTEGPPISRAEFDELRRTFGANPDAVPTARCTPMPLSRRT